MIRCCCEQKLQIDSLVLCGRNERVDTAPTNGGDCGICGTSVDTDIGDTIGGVEGELVGCGRIRVDEKSDRFDPNSPLDLDNFSAAVVDERAINGKAGTPIVFWLCRS